MVIWTLTEMAGQKGCCGGPTYCKRAGQSREELGCTAEGTRNKTSWENTHPAILGQNAVFVSAARTLLTAQDQQRLICVQYDLLNTCISVMDGVVIYIVAYVDIQVTRFDSILPVKGNGTERRKQTAPSVTRVQAKGREECVELSYATASFLSIFTNSFIGADTQCISSTGRGRKWWNCSLGCFLVLLPWEMPTISKCIVGLFFLNKGITLLQLYVSHVPALWQAS